MVGWVFLKDKPSTDDVPDRAGGEGGGSLTDDETQ